MMNTQIIDFLKNVNNENLVGAKENIHASLSAKVAEALASREAEIRTSLYNCQKEE